MDVGGARRTEVIARNDQLFVLPEWIPLYWARKAWGKAARRVLPGRGTVADFARRFPVRLAFPQPIIGASRCSHGAVAVFELALVARAPRLGAARRDAEARGRLRDRAYREVP